MRSAERAQHPAGVWVRKASPAPCWGVGPAPGGGVERVLVSDVSCVRRRPPRRSDPPLHWLGGLENRMGDPQGMWIPPASEL
eukprot:3252381-Rhodomonas_salina.1